MPLCYQNNLPINQKAWILHFHFLFLFLEQLTFNSPQTIQWCFKTLYFQRKNQIWTWKFINVVFVMLAKYIDLIHGRWVPLFVVPVGILSLCNGISALCTSNDIRNCVAVLLQGDDPSDSQAVMAHLLFHRLSINDWCRSVSMESDFFPQVVAVVALNSNQFSSFEQQFEFLSHCEDENRVCKVHSLLWDFFVVFRLLELCGVLKRAGSNSAGVTACPSNEELEIVFSPSQCKRNVFASNCCC